MAKPDAPESVRNLRRRLRLDKLHPFPRKVIVGLVGGLCFTAGIIMIFTPGPAVVFIPLGLLLLASEFAWAERWLHRVKRSLHQARIRWRLHRRRRARSRS